jgi:hypothetical protein
MREVVACGVGGVEMHHDRVEGVRVRACGVGGVGVGFHH